MTEAAFGLQGVAPVEHGHRSQSDTVMLCLSYSCYYATFTKLLCMTVCNSAINVACAAA